MYRFLCPIAFLVLALISPLAARADNISIFTVDNATFASGATGSGTVTIDTTIGAYVGLDFTYQLGATTLVFDTISGQGSFNNSQYYFYSFNADGDLLDLGVPGTSLVGYGGGPICTTTGPASCGASGYIVPAGGDVDPQTTGSLSAVPEPSSLLLLATGAVFMTNTARRRIAA